MSPFHPALWRELRTLHLTSAERAYLFELTRKRDPDAAADGEPRALPDSLVSALDTITAPAYVLDRLWCACGSNLPARKLFAQWLDGRERNLLRYVFLDPSARDFIRGWENRARRIVAEFRADTARGADDKETTSLVQELCETSPQFAQFWNDHSVLAREGGTREFNHPLDGPLRYEQITLIPPARSGCKLVILMRA